MDLYKIAQDLLMANPLAFPRLTPLFPFIKIISLNQGSLQAVTGTKEGTRALLIKSVRFPCDELSNLISETVSDGHWITVWSTRFLQESSEN